MRGALSIVALGLLLVFAGCLGGPTGGDGRSPSPPADSPTATPAPGSPSPTPTPANTEYDVHVIDTSAYGPAVVEGGISAPAAGDDTTTALYYVTTLASASEAEARLNRSALGEDTLAVVDATDFEREIIVVVQTYPDSSVPDARVESAAMAGGSLDLHINDSSQGGTADITLETMFVRVAGSEPERVTVTDEDGVSWSSTDGVVTRTPEPTSTPSDVELPYQAADPAENVAEPRGVVVENSGNETNGYTVEVVYHEEPDCWDATPPCDLPVRRIEVLGETGKIPAGATKRFDDVAARTGRYTVTVIAEVPGSDGGRETVRTSADWHLDVDAPEVHVVITDEDVRFVSPAPENGRESGSNDTEGHTTTTAEPRTTTPS